MNIILIFILVIFKKTFLFTLLFSKSIYSKNSCFSGIPSNDLIELLDKLNLHKNLRVSSPSIFLI